MTATVTLWPANSDLALVDVDTRTEWDPKIHPPGDLGKQSYFPNVVGPF